LKKSKTAYLLTDTQTRNGLARPIPLRWLTSAVVASMVALAMLMIHLRLSIAINGASAAFAVAAGTLFLVRYRFRADGPRPRPMLSNCAEDVLLFSTIALAGAIASYAVAACTEGWVDEAMVRFDRSIDFDWRDLYAVTAAHPILQISGRIVYASIFASPAILLLSFNRHGQRAEARQFLASFWLAALVSLFLFRFLPTLGPLSYMWHGPISYMPTSGLYQADLIPMLREQRMHVIDLAVLRGLVGPPSFHAASAVLYILAAWRTRKLRVPLTILNVAMLFSIPVEGTHYAIDVISGASVALAAYLTVTFLAKAWLSTPASDNEAAPYALHAGTKGGCQKA
jgi:hypothetical protein